MDELQKSQASAGLLPPGFLMPPGGFTVGASFGNGLFVGPSAGSVGTVVDAAGQVAGSFDLKNGGEVTPGNGSAAVLNSYTSRKGDTLWSIAKKQYGDGRKWRKVLEANTDRVKAPNALKAGTVLVMPEV